MGFRLICHMTQNIFFQFLGWWSPWGGSRMPPSPNFGSYYGNISQNQCPCRISASYLIRCGHAPLNKTVNKKSIFRSFSGHFQLLTVKWVVKWAFNWHIWIELFMGFRLICHMTQNIFFQFLGWCPGCPPRPFLVHVTYQWKAHEKLYSNMSIKCSFDHSFDRQQLKWPENRFLITVLFRGACPHRMR